MRILSTFCNTGMRKFDQKLNWLGKIYHRILRVTNVSAVTNEMLKQGQK